MKAFRRHVILSLSAAVCKSTTAKSSGYFRFCFTAAGYTDEYIAEQEEYLPEFCDAELDAIHSPVNVPGLNVYTPEYIMTDLETPGEFRQLPCRNHIQP